MAPSFVKRWATTLPDLTVKTIHPNLILAVVCSAMFLDLANLSAVTIALPTIGKQLHTEDAQLQWLISAYALTFGSFLLLGGRGGDLFGHKLVLLFGAYIFALFTLICAVAPSFIGLTVARAFQGIGAGFTIPAAQAHVAIYFPDPAKRANALGFWAAAGSLGFIVGLILGGVLTALLSWRWIFWISLISSGIILPTAHLVLPSPPQKSISPSSSISGPSDGADEENGILRTSETAKARFVNSFKAGCTRFDVLGICLVVPGLLLLTYALTSSNTLGWGSAPIISTLVISVVLLALFVFRETKASQPLINPKLFHDLSFNLTLVLSVATYAVRQACTYFLTLQLQSYGNSPLHTAVLFLPLGISALITNTISGRLVPIFGARAMFSFGWTLCIPGVVLFSRITPDTSYWRFTFPGMILYIAGIGIVYITANFVVISSASKTDQGAVAGVFNVALQVGGSVLGLAVLTAVADGINKRYGGPGASSDHLSEIGYQSVYYSCIILCGIALAISLFAVKVPDAMRGTIWKKKEVAEVTSEEPKAPAVEEEPSAFNDEKTPSPSDEADVPEKSSVTREPDEVPVINEPPK